MGIDTQYIRSLDGAWVEPIKGPELNVYLGTAIAIIL